MEPSNSVPPVSFLSGLNGSSSNLPDTTGRSFTTSFSAQSGSAAAFNHLEKIFPSVIGTIQGLHNIHGSFNIPNMPGSLASRNSTINGGHPGGIQQPTGSLSNGRFPINHLPTALSQLSHASSHGHPGVTNRGGSGVSPMLGNTGPRITSSIGNLAGGGNIGRSLSSGGGLAMPGLASHLSLISNGSGNMGIQGSNRLMGGVLSQGSGFISTL
ncbi:putative NOT transcription complex subunit VIP2 [Vitis vinifera]|uniref:Putative NOT transcription complex subunit VIP2 n=1 Tax=Vitis vinifera TaxID=29760 RepID=A0A438JJ87_VITVI|nr:putative NOT transcription complex subunit VIP2 [Vitis vinifera]